MIPCSKCGNPFEQPQNRGGRPRTRCDSCRGAHASIDGAKWRKLREKLLRGNPPCQICWRAPATQLDHIVPLARGGHPYDEANLQVSCASCNARKKARLSNFGPDAPSPKPVASGPRIVREWLDGNARVTEYSDGTEHRETALCWYSDCDEPLHIHGREPGLWSL